VKCRELLVRPMEISKIAGVPFDRLRAGFRLRESFDFRTIHFAQDDNFRLMTALIMEDELRTN
jgi:hypothetical protein